MFNTCEELVIVTVDCVLSEPLPTLREDVEICKQAMFALITTFPVGKLTVIPAPGVWLTDDTAPVLYVENSCEKLFCVFWNAVLIASADGSSGNVPKSIFCWAMFISPYLLFIVLDETTAQKNTQLLPGILCC